MHRVLSFLLLTATPLSAAHANEPAIPALSCNTTSEKPLWHRSRGHMPEQACPQPGQDPLTAACPTPPQPQPECGQGVTPDMIEAATKRIGATATATCVARGNKSRFIQWSKKVFTDCVTQMAGIPALRDGLRR
jgi:hypothetical protein